jgi:hypothetical protein
MPENATVETRATIFGDPFPTNKPPGEEACAENPSSINAGMTESMENSPEINVLYLFSLDYQHGGLFCKP